MTGRPGEAVIMREIRRYHRGILDSDMTDSEKAQKLRHLEIMLHSTIVVVGGEADRVEQRLKGDSA